MKKTQSTSQIFVKEWLEYTNLSRTIAYTMSDVAELSGLSRATLYRILKHGLNSESATLRQIADGLGVEATQLLTQPPTHADTTFSSVENTPYLMPGLTPEQQDRLREKLEECTRTVQKKELNFVGYGEMSGDGCEWLFDLVSNLRQVKQILRTTTTVDDWRQTCRTVCSKLGEWLLEKQAAIAQLGQGDAVREVIDLDAGAVFVMALPWSAFLAGVTVSQEHVVPADTRMKGLCERLLILQGHARHGVFVELDSLNSKTAPSSWTQVLLDERQALAKVKASHLPKPSQR